MNPPKLGTAVTYTDTDGKRFPAILMGVMPDGIASLLIEPGTENARFVSSVDHAENVPPRATWEIT